MMGNINIKINKNTRQVNLSKSVIGNDGENLQEKLVFSFNDFINGTARLELIKQGETASYIMLTKVGETYELPIKSVMTKAGRLNMQLVITEGTDDEEIPVFKSNQFYMIVNSSINAEIEEDDEYPQWIDVANTKLNEIDEALDDLEEKLDSGYFKGDKGDRGDPGPAGPAGTSGQDGRDGYIQYTAGDNITIENNVISATGGSEYGPTNKLNADYIDDSISINKFQYIGELVEIKDTTGYVDFKKAKRGVYIPNLSSETTQYVSSVLNNTIHASFQLKYVCIYITKEITNMEQAPSEKTYFGIMQGLDTSSGEIAYVNLYVDTNGIIGQEKKQPINWPKAYYITNQEQEITGLKKYITIPQVSSYTAPINDKELVAKKYVDDSISNKFWIGTQTEYDAITTKDSNILYFIQEA